MTIQAIETRYAGCRFRSRLEARWAVFFDHLGIAWEYELQGLEVSHRLTRTEGRFPYLPDFWLPDLRFWAEVKGSLTEDEALRLLDAAASLSSNDGGGCHDAGGNDVLILGPIPRNEGFGCIYHPWRLHMHKGSLNGSHWDFDQESPGSGCVFGGHNFGAVVARDYGGSLHEIMSGADFHPGTITKTLLRGQYGPTRRNVMRALDTARSARFEHGESG